MAMGREQEPGQDRDRAGTDRSAARGTGSAGAAGFAGPAGTAEAPWRERYEEERRKLAMLWKAFEDAEARIAALEAAAAAPAPAPAPAPQAPEVVEVARPAAPPALQPVPRYPVGLYRVSEVPGVSPAEAEQLRAYGVNLTDALLYADLDRLAGATGIDRGALQRWRDLSELMAIGGIGATWARELVDAGVTGIRQLAAMTPEELYRTLVRSHETRGTPEKERLLMERTLPARSKKLIAAAKRAARAL